MEDTQLANSGGKKDLSASLQPFYFFTFYSGKEKSKSNKQANKKRTSQRKKVTASYPSMKGQRSQEHWIGATGNHRRQTRCPEPSFWLRSTLPVASVLTVGGVVENQFVYRVAQTLTQLLRRQMFRTSVCNRTRHLDFPPKLCSNPIFNP